MSSGWVSWLSCLPLRGGDKETAVFVVGLLLCLPPRNSAYLCLSDSFTTWRQEKSPHLSFPERGKCLGVNLRSALSLWSRTSQQGLQWEKPQGLTCVCSSKQEVNRGLISWLWHYVVSKLVLKAYCIQRHIIGISRYQTDLFFTLSLHINDSLFCCLLM